MRRLAPAFLLPLALLSCAPPFDPDLSLAAITMAKLTYQSTVATGIKVSTGSPDLDAVFLPVKSTEGSNASVDPSRGFVVITSSTGVSLMFIRPDGNGGFVRLPDPSVSSPLGIGGLNGRDPNYPAFEARTVWAGDYVAVFSYDSAQPINNSAVIYQASTGLTTLFAPKALAGPFLPLMASPVVVLGAQLDLANTAGGDGQYLLARDGSGHFHEVFLTAVNSAGFTGALDLSGPLPTVFSAIPAGLNRCLYYHDGATGLSYASYFADGQWQCWRWQGGGTNARRLTGIPCRIDSLLSTGELLSTQGGVGRLFDSSGNLLTSFPLGSLRYSMEAYVNGTATVFFSGKAIHDGALSLVLYSTLSSKVRSLTY